MITQVHLYGIDLLLVDGLLHYPVSKVAFVSHGTRKLQIIFVRFYFHFPLLSNFVRGLVEFLDSPSPRYFSFPCSTSLKLLDIC